MYCGHDRQCGQTWKGPLAVGQEPGFSLPLTHLHDPRPVPFPHQRGALTPQTFIPHLCTWLARPSLGVPSVGGRRDSQTENPPGRQRVPECHMALRQMRALLTELPSRTSCANGSALQLSCPKWEPLATMWLLSCQNVASATEKLTFTFYLVLIN